MELREQVSEYLALKESEGKKISQATFAKMVGIAESTFSRWNNDTYPADASKIEKQIVDFLEKERDRSRLLNTDGVEFAMTKVSEDILYTLDYCRLQKQMVVIYGDAGVGKTYTSTEWKKDKENIIFITASPAISSPKAILKKLARQIKTRISGNKDDLYCEIVDKITGTDYTVIIDEAQHLNYATLEMIRSIKDECNIGLALIGNAVIYDKLTGKQEAQFAQLFSRLLMRRHIMTDQFSRDDIVKVFGLLNEEELDYLLDVCRSRYSLRGAIFLYMNAVNNENTTKSGLKTMAKNMGILV